MAAATAACAADSSDGAACARRRGALDAIGEPAAVGADLAGELLERAFSRLRVARGDRRCRCRSPPRRRG